MQTLSFSGELAWLYGALPHGLLDPLLWPPRARAGLRFVPLSPLLQVAGLLRGCGMHTSSGSSPYAAGLGFRGLFHRGFTGFPRFPVLLLHPTCFEAAWRPGHRGFLGSHP